MATTDLTDATFEQAIAEHDIVLVDFWADWCGPCRQFAPTYAAASEKHPDILFAKVDTEAEQGIAGAARITSIPTLMAFREGVLVFQQPGALPPAALEEVIDGVRGLDMADVHRRIDRQRELLDKPREVSVEDLVVARAAGAPVVDVREHLEYETGHVPGAVLMPLRTVPERFGELPVEGPVYVICASGNRSLQATDALRRAGVEAYSVAGGTSAWRAAGHEVDFGVEVPSQPA